MYKNWVFKLQNVQICEVKVGLFTDCQEWRFQAAKLSDTSSAILQEGRFADAQESRFQAANR